VIQVKFTYKGHWVKVKVTGAKQCEICCFRNVKLSSTITAGSVEDRVCVQRGFFGYCGTADRMVRPPSLSRDPKYMRSRVVCLKLKAGQVKPRFLVFLGF